jgi:hypothetical protein
MFLKQRPNDFIHCADGCGTKDAMLLQPAVKPFFIKIKGVELRRQVLPNKGKVLFIHFSASF